VDKDTYLLELLRYVVLNPVRAKMVKAPERYPWSSYRAIAGYEEAPAWLAADRVLSLFGDDRTKAQADYRDVVNGSMGDPRSPWDSVRGQIYLGSAGWVEEVKRRLDAPAASEQEVVRPVMAAVVSAVANACVVDEDEVRNRRGGQERMVAAWLGCFEGALTMRSIAAGLRLRSSERASHLVRKCDRALTTNPELRLLVERCSKELQHNPVIADDQRRARWAASASSNG
jgi:hypothetical protein